MHDHQFAQFDAHNRFLFQWPTLVTLAVFPILVFMCAHLAKREERDARAEFGDAYTRCEANTPAFSPGLD